MISDVAAGPGWWRASDGKWYPPELHPQRSVATTIGSGADSFARTDAPATAVSLRPPVSQPSTAGIASRGRASEQLSISVTPAARRRLDRAPLDVRGLLVSTASALLLAACFLPWYLLTSVDSATGIGGQTVSILDAPFGGWRMAIPLVAAVAVVCGIFDAFLRADAPGAMTSFIALRALVLGELGLVAVALVSRTPHGVAGALGVAASLRWPAWAALGCVVVAVGGSFAAAPGKT